MQAVSLIGDDAAYVANFASRGASFLRSRFGQSYRGIVGPKMEEILNAAVDNRLTVAQGFELINTPLPAAGMAVVVASAALFELYALGFRGVQSQWPRVPGAPS